MSQKQLPEKQLHIAWTVDDGPQKFTQSMAANFPSKGLRERKAALRKTAMEAREKAKKAAKIAQTKGATDQQKADAQTKKVKAEKAFAELEAVLYRPATWYIVRDELTTNSLGIIRKLQDEGHEIAIHGLHETKNHLSWLPSHKKPSYSSVNEALVDLKNFRDFLASKGITVKFVRLPYGLLTEVVHNLEKLGLTQDTGKTARKIISGQISPQGETVASKVAKNFADLKTEIQQLGLHLWGGSKNGSISVQSWEAESAGVNTGRTDTVPQQQINAMERLSRGQGGRTSYSYVILCHDNSASDVSEVQMDIKRMEQEAKKRHIEVIYHTMSSLYQQVTGKKP
ncbi:MAG: hypothetical protein SVR94_00970 [Pseudomonadota bacterium]|nr:hypothetical protein [Pseudomonadota bacterium]